MKNRLVVLIDGFNLYQKHFRTSMFPDEIDLGNGHKVKRPTKWA
ncbi:MAG TPA: hypothetical protein VJB38_01060 [Bacteroidota bacterium]|nr:hypothetical protein [Bacteroidota bacterium]